MKQKPITMNINDSYEYPKNTKNHYSKDLLYKEKSKVFEQEFTLNKNLSVIDQLKVLSKYLNKLTVEIKKLENDFAFYKLFKPVAKVDDITINNLFVDYKNLDKYINLFNEKLERLVSIFSEFDKDYKILGTNIPVDEKITKEDASKYYDEIIYLYSYINGLKKDLNDIKKKYFHEFKLTSYGITRGKTTDEILELTQKVDKELTNFRTLANASDYYQFNCGVEIQELVDEFLKLNKKYPYLTYKYFLNQDAIIAFSFTEWVELFVKFNYVLGKINQSDITEKLILKYKELEVKYCILLINSEK